MSAAAATGPRLLETSVLCAEDKQCTQLRKCRGIFALGFSLKSLKLFAQVSSNQTNQISIRLSLEHWKIMIELH